jgi:peptide/nickel transport system permease protein
MASDDTPQAEIRGALRWIVGLTDHYMLRNVVNALRLMLKERSVRIWFGIILAILVLGVIGPSITPYEHDERVYDDQGQMLINGEPSLAHPLGTTDTGYDVLSRVLVGARPTVITGALGGTIIIAIGGVIGITAGYVGGRTENILMRFTDLAYGIPLLPTALVVVGLLGIGFLTSIIVIGLIIWRGTARVLRSQVLQIKERPYVLAAKSTGASTPRIIVKHILPNVGTMVILFFALSVGYTILIQAGLAYLGVSDPATPAWGIMVRNAQTAGRMSASWWWSVPPGLLISITVMSTFMFGRGYENVAGSGNDDALVEAG